MSSIIEIMQAMGYTPEEAGVCFGISAMGAQATLRKQTGSFMNRIYHIRNSSEESLETLINNDDLKLRPFFDELSIYQGPNGVRPEFKEFIPSFTQGLSCLTKISPKVEDELYILPKTERTIVNRYSFEQISNFVKQLKNYFGEEPFSLIIIEPFMSHACHIGFDGEKWLSCDHDDILLCENTDEGVNEAVANIFTPEISGKTLSVDIVLANNHKVAISADELNGFGFNASNVTFEFDKNVLSELVLSCAFSNDYKLLNELLDRVKELNFSDEEIFNLINARCEDGDTALLIASSKGFSKVVNMFLDVMEKLDIDDETRADLLGFKNNNNTSALYMAVQNGHTEIVDSHLNAIKMLKINDEAKYDFVTFKSNTGATTLMMAAYDGYSDIANLLLNFMNYIDISDEAKNNYMASALPQGQTALFIAAQNGYHEIIEHLQKAIFRSALSEEDKVKLLDGRSNNNASPLIIAVYDDHIETVQAIVEGILHSDLSAQSKATLIMSSSAEFDISAAYQYAKEIGRDNIARYLWKTIFNSDVFSQREKFSILGMRRH